MQALIKEIQRRKVFNTFLPYLGIVWLLLQVVSVLVPMLNLSPLVNTLTVVILFTGIPVMLYVSWYFNITSNGLEAIPDANSEEAARFGVSKWLVFLSITVLSGYAGVSYFYKVKVEYAKTAEGSSQQLIASSLAVIPFTDSSPEKDQDYLANGIAAEVASLIGSANKLRVIDLHSVNILAAQNLDPVSIARRLNVETVLTGTVRITGNNIRLRAELIQVSDGKVLWSDSYTRKLDQIFALESTLARAIINSLSDDFISADDFKHPSETKSVEAYQMYMRGRAAYAEQTIESLKEARKFFEQSLAIAPDFSKAYVALADTVLLSSDRSKNFDILVPEIAKQLAQNYLAKVLVQTQALPQAFAVQGQVFHLDGQLDNALASYNKALSLNGSLATAHELKYKVLKDLGRQEEAFAALKVALEHNPESTSLKAAFATEQASTPLVNNLKFSLAIWSQQAI